MDRQTAREMFRESRRSTRVPLKVMIRVENSAERLTCEGETVVVNLHGALLATEMDLKLHARIVVQVHLTGKEAEAQVVYIDPEDRSRCGIALDQPRNIWGVALPPEDWTEIVSDTEKLR